jgi:hypothetical protein
MMAEETKNKFVLTTTETRVKLRHRGSCMCKWRGEWHETIEEAKADRDAHHAFFHSQTVR